VGFAKRRVGLHSVSSFGALEIGDKLGAARPAPADIEAPQQRREAHAPVGGVVTDYEHNGAVSAAIGPRGRAVVVFSDVRERPGRDRRLVLAWTHGSRDGFSRRWSSAHTPGSRG
jgi:hypothetical protein